MKSWPCSRQLSSSFSSSSGFPQRKELLLTELPWQSRKPVVTVLPNLSHRVGTTRLGTLPQLLVPMGLVNNCKDLYVRPGNDSQGDKEEHGLSINPPLIQCFRLCLYQNAKVIREEWERQTTKRGRLYPANCRRCKEFALIF